MLRNTGKAIGWGNVALVAVFGAAWPIQAQDAKAQDAKSPYPSMAPIGQYRMDRDAEIALARTAAPPSISRDATILVLGQKNFEIAVQGNNGFVCAGGQGVCRAIEQPGVLESEKPEPHMLQSTRRAVPHALCDERDRDGIGGRLQSPDHRCDQDRRRQERAGSS